MADSDPAWVLIRDGLLEMDDWLQPLSVEDIETIAFQLAPVVLGALARGRAEGAREALTAAAAELAERVRELRAAGEDKRLVAGLGDARAIVLVRAAGIAPVERSGWEDHAPAEPVDCGTCGTSMEYSDVCPWLDCPHKPTAPSGVAQPADACKISGPYLPVGDDDPFCSTHKVYLTGPHCPVGGGEYRTLKQRRVAPADTTEENP